MAQQSLEDKNAEYIARIRGQNNKKNNHSPQEKKISLFGANEFSKAKVSPKKKKSKYVELPDTGIRLTETQLFTKYSITSEKIGSGAFASIKVIREHQTGKQYALKFVKKKGRTFMDINTFKKEILYLSKLTNHPNIIRMYDFCDSQIGLYMVLEYCNGGDVLSKLNKCKRFSEREAKSVSRQIVAGMCYYHSFNIVHRDLKPDNLMYNNGIIKIIDFGLAGDCSLNPLRSSCGTPHYTSPEVVSDQAYTTKADMWSLGVNIFQFIAGEPPFLESTGNQQNLFKVIRRGQYSFPPRYFDHGCDASLRDLISRLLDLNMQRRWSAEQVRNHQWFKNGKGNEHIGGMQQNGNNHQFGGYRRAQSAEPQSIYSNGNGAMKNVQNVNKNMQNRHQNVQKYNPNQQNYGMNQRAKSASPTFVQNGFNNMNIRQNKKGNERKMRHSAGPKNMNNQFAQNGNRPQQNTFGKPPPKMRNSTGNIYKGMNAQQQAGGKTNNNPRQLRRNGFKNNQKLMSAQNIQMQTHQNQNQSKKPPSRNQRPMKMNPSQQKNIFDQPNNNMNFMNGFDFNKQPNKIQQAQPFSMH